ncbi:hypothetical protein KC19_11G127800, partial [Ceratodon purpureus]
VWVRWSVEDGTLGMLTTSVSRNELRLMRAGSFCGISKEGRAINLRKKRTLSGSEDDPDLATIAARASGCGMITSIMDWNLEATIITDCNGGVMSSQTPSSPQT